jgi:hypothetical protein
MSAFRVVRKQLREIGLGCSAASCVWGALDKVTDDPCTCLQKVKLNKAEELERIRLVREGIKLLVLEISKPSRIDTGIGFL